MVSFTSAIFAMIAAIGLVQVCPAPSGSGAKLIGKFGGHVVGKIDDARKNHRRRESEFFPRALPPGVPTYVMDLCVSQVQGQGRPVEINSLDATSECPECMIYPKEICH